VLEVERPQIRPQISSLLQYTKRLTPLYVARQPHNHSICPSQSQQTSQITLTAITCARNIRLKHLCYSKIQGTPIVAMPTQIHKVLKGFVSDIKAQISLQILPLASPLCPLHGEGTESLKCGLHVNNSLLLSPIIFLNVHQLDDKV
jgi:hypothetical protein